MRRLILSMMVSLDGYIARPDGDLSWFLGGEDFEAEMVALLRSVDGYLFGRVSYELLSTYWPTAGAPDAGDAPGGFSSAERRREFAHLMNTVPKLVASRTLADPSWGPSRVIRDVASELPRLLAEPGRDLVLFAGADLAASCMNLDLVDRYHLLVHPILLGGGISLFERVRAEQRLTLTRTRAFADGVALLEYARDRRAA